VSNNVPEAMSQVTDNPHACFFVVKIFSAIKKGIQKHAGQTKKRIITYWDH
jgi:hypothetical protein